MKPAPFAYAKARSVAHAIELLVDDDARLLAGGQSLIATLNMRLEPSRPAGRHQRHGRARPDRVEQRAYRDRRAGPPRASRALARDCKAGTAHRFGHAAYRSSRHPQPRHHRRLGRLRRSGGRAAGVRARTGWRARRLPGRRGPASSKPTISSRACSRPRLPPVTCLPPSASPPPAPTPASASPSSRAATATMPWWDLPPARGRTANACAISAWPISAWPPRRSAHIMRSRR